MITEEMKMNLFKKALEIEQLIERFDPEDEIHDGLTYRDYYSSELAGALKMLVVLGIDREYIGWAEKKDSEYIEWAEEKI